MSFVFSHKSLSLLPILYRAILCVQRYKKMLELLFITLLIVTIALILLCVKMLFKKDGHFLSAQISRVKVVRRCGTYCMKAQDREARIKKYKII